MLKFVKYFLILLYFSIFMIWTALLLIPVPVLSLPPFVRQRKAYVHFVSGLWGKHFAVLSGARVVLSGVENVPETDRLCVVANHQGMFDILVVLGWFPKGVGFIAKKELMILPIINVWMKVMHCFFINRKNLRKSAESIEKGVEQIRRGHPVVIFPEGTRSRGGAMGEFKPGSIKLATKADAVIVPVTLDGTYNLYEARGAITLDPAEIRMTIHPAIDTAGLDIEARKALPEKLKSIIASALPGGGAAK
jgi:1-acyl-sn-glycerol-3-phosphate acyltransferase